MVWNRLGRFVRFAKLQANVSVDCRTYTTTLSPSPDIKACQSIFPKPLTVKQCLHSTPDPNKKITLQGWISSTVKLKKKIGFFHLTDGLSNEKIQVVLAKEAIESFSSGLHYGSYVVCNGVIVSSPGKQQSTEMLCHQLEFSSACATLPFHNKTGLEDSWDTIRQHQHLRAKSSAYLALLRVRSHLIQLIHEVMHECDAHNIVTPLLTQNDCEGGGEVFQVKAKDEQLNPYFGRSTFLTVSGQLHLESAVQGLPSVYTLSNCFRSEYSLSRRHLCEFSMLEVEQAYMDSLPILMDKVEALCKTLAGRLLERAADDLAFVQKQQPNPYVDKIINSTYLRITYDEAIELCRQHGGFDIELGANMNTKHETFLLQHFDHRPIFVTHYPFGMKPFYMLVEHDRALNFDLLYPVCGEVCGGSLREHRKEVMQRKFKDAEFDCTFDWYNELRQYGSIPHGGFGIGVDRFLQPLLNLSNIRDIVTFPRWLHHCDT